MCVERDAVRPGHSEWLKRGRSGHLNHGVTAELPGWTEVLRGHVSRHEGLARTILKGSVEGKNCRGRPELKYMRKLMK